MRNTYDAIVIGLGAMGSASVYQLAKRGLKVLGIDQFSPPHAHGSTHGNARIMRLAIGEGAQYTPLSRRSNEIFREMESDTGAKLLEVTGMLTISSTDTAVIESEGDFFDNTVAAARRYDIRHDVLNANDMRRRFPQFSVGDGERGYFEYDAGYLRPEQCIRTQLELAQRKGAVLRTNEQVRKVDATTGGVLIQTSRGSYSAEQIVISAGPWLPELIPQEYGQIFQVHRLVQYWFDIAGYYDVFRLGNTPIFFWQLPGYDRWIYGFPALDGANGGLSLAAANPQDAANSVTPATIARAVSEAEIDFVFAQYVAKCLPEIGRKLVKSETCMYTATPDGGFIIDRHPEFPQIVVCSPCSGHGFKHSAAIGECVALILTNDSTGIDLRKFKFERFCKVG